MRGDERRLQPQRQPWRRIGSSAPAVLTVATKI